MDFEGVADLSDPFAKVLQHVCPTKGENTGTTSMLEETASSPAPQETQAP